MEELTNCPVCDNGEFAPYIQCKDYTVSQEKFTIVACKKCNFKFTNPRPLEGDLGKYYESDEYISHSNTSQGIIAKLYQFARHYTLAKKLQLVSSLSKKKGAILDYGCGTGEFLNTCKNANWETMGVEPSKVGRASGTDNYGLEVYEDIFNTAFDGKQFNVITLWHVIEHVSQLKPTLERLISLLPDGGHLVIAVPNPASLDASIYKEHWAAYDVPRHLYHFTPDSIETLCTQYPLKQINILPMVLDSFYVSMLSEKYKSQDNGKNSPFGLFKAFWNGFRSNMNAAMHPGTSSSQIYIFKKIDSITEL